MVFPTTPLVVLVELLIGGTWTDITDDVYLRDMITITRGRKDQGAHVDAGRCALTLNNRSGDYSLRYPLGAYFGLLSRNTPIRVSVLTGDTALVLSGAATAGASTPDHLSLDVTGDLDIRLAASLENWYDNPADINMMDLAGKYLPTGDQRSWLLSVSSTGVPRMVWTTDGTVGTAQLRFATENMPVPATQRIAVRVTVDVDNGAGGNTTTFYTAESISGPWMQLGDSVTASGTTSIYASTASLDLGHVANPDTIRQPEGNVHAFEMRNGIDGTIVANPDFTTQTSGASSFTDGAGRLWTIGTGAELTNRQIRFSGEVSAWSSRWDVSGNDVYVPIEAGGIRRRLGQGESPLPSALRRTISGLSPAPAGYWPCEDGENATQAASWLPGGTALAVTGSVTFGGTGTPVGSNGAADFANGGTLSGAVSPSGSGWSAIFWMDLPSGTSVRPAVIIRTPSSPVWREYRIQANDGGTTVTVTAVDGDGTTTTAVQSTGLTLAGAGPRMVWVDAVQSGSNIDYQLTIAAAGDTVIGSDTGTLTSDTVTGIRSVGVNTNQPTTATSGQISHIIVDQASTSDRVFAVLASAAGHAGEQSATRILRLCTDEGVSIRIQGAHLDTEPVGAQVSDTLLNLLDECLDADGGILYEWRGGRELRYRARTLSYNQEPSLQLDYAAGDVSPPLDPDPDDYEVRNDIEVERIGGTSYRAVRETGPLNVQDPGVDPDGIGRYDSHVPLNLAADAQTVDIAEWRLHLGAWETARYSSVHVDLAATPQLIGSALAVDSGARIQIAHPPAGQDPDTIDLIAEGYTETIGEYDWDITFNCSPAGPWSVAMTDDTVLGRADTDGSVLAADVTSTATTMFVQTTEGPVWTTDPAECPMDLRVGGEVITATAITSAIADAFGRTVADGWGTADVGGAWTTTGGSATDFSVGGGVGVHSAGTRNVFRFSTLPAPAADVDVQTGFSTGALAAGDALYVFLMARYTDGNNFYFARVQMTTTQTMVLSLRKRTTAGGEVELAAATLTGLTHAAGTLYTARLQVAGSTLSAKAWLTAGVEPPVWQVTATDTDITVAGAVGVRTLVPTANTTALPVIFSFDDFALTNPQALTVTRSVNGVVKSHAAGADVRLAQPAIVAL